MTEDWTSYLCELSGAPASVFVDLGLRAVAPDPERPLLVVASVRMHAPRPDGLSSDEEAHTLFDIEDALTAALAAAADARPAGRVTTKGQRVFFAYARTAAAVEDAVRGVFARFPAYHASVGTRTDAGWRYYLDVLHPDPEEHRRIAARAPDDEQRARNAQTVAQLRAHGDQLAVPRPVTHYAYFPSAAGRAEFVRRAGELDFEPQRATDAAGGERPFGVVLGRTHAVDEPTLEAVVLPLAALARAAGGEYDGWETPVTRWPAA